MPGLTGGGAVAAEAAVPVAATILANPEPEPQPIQKKPVPQETNLEQELQQERELEMEKIEEGEIEAQDPANMLGISALSDMPEPPQPITNLNSSGLEPLTARKKMYA